MPDTTEAPTTNISAQMRSAIGVQFGRRVSFPISESDIRKWALAVYYPGQPPLAFLDSDAAAASQDHGLRAPEDFNPFAWIVADQDEVPAVDGNDPDRTELILGISGPGLKYQLNGGLEVDYGVLMRPSDVITSVSRLAEYRERPGRLGLMLITTFADTWTNQRGELVKTTRLTLIRY